MACSRVEGQDQNQVHSLTSAENVLSHREAHTPFGGTVFQQDNSGLTQDRAEKCVQMGLAEVRSKEEKGGEPHG